MKLNQHIDGYDIKSLSDIEHSVTRMKAHCEKLDLLGNMLKNNIQFARGNGFQSVNCDKAEGVIDEYCKKLKNAENEFDELAVSVQKFIERIHNIWNSWT